MSSNDEDFAAVERLSRQWMQAWVTQDSATLDRTRCARVSRRILSIATRGMGQARRRRHKKAPPLLTGHCMP